jgi:hypothetical protein
LTLFLTIKNFFHSFRAEHAIMRTGKWTEQLLNLGFDKIAFPILIKDGADLNLVYLKEFAIDSDLHSLEFESNFELIDSNGQVWTWKYDHINKTNLPGDLIRTMSLDEVKEIVNGYFDDTKIKTDIEALTKEASSIHDLLEKLESKF